MCLFWCAGKVGEDLSTVMTVLEQKKPANREASLRNFAGKINTGCRIMCCTGRCESGLGASPGRNGRNLYGNGTKKSLAAYAAELAEPIKFYAWEQYRFQKDWLRIKEYANARTISVFGDLPIFVAADSVDCWSIRDLFTWMNRAILWKRPVCRRIISARKARSGAILCTAGNVWNKTVSVGGWNACAACLTGWIGCAWIIFADLRLCSGHSGTGGRCCVRALVKRAGEEFV